MLKLRYTTTSPFARKVYVVALETRVAGQIDRLRADPWDSNDDLPRQNPLGKVPALIFEDGQVLYDSTVIAEYLDSLHDGQKMFPASGPERWQALRLNALADGIQEAAILRFIEYQKRPPELRWQAWIDRQRDKIERALTALEFEQELLDGPVTIGNIAVAVALEYVDFRFRDLQWRDDRPRLTAWHDEFAARPTMQATRLRIAG